MMEKKIRLRTINDYITCRLCKGYLIDATTITECLHTFCKSCLVKFLEEKNFCPTCKIIIHQSHPLNYISHDRTMQDIVYKLVPNLQENETEREKEYYTSRGMEHPKHLTNGNDALNENEVKPPHEDPDSQDYHRSDEQVSICLEGKGLHMKNLSRRFIRCSTHATVTHLKKFIALKTFNSLTKYKDIDILCNDELLGKDHTLKFVAVTRWRVKDCPLELHYRQRMDL